MNTCGVAGQPVGFAPVSNLDQNAERQLEWVNRDPCFTGRVSDEDTDGADPRSA